MRKGRYIVFCAGAFLAGDFFGGWLAFSATIYLSAGVLFALLSFRFRVFPIMLLALFFLGAGGLQTERIPTDGTLSKIERDAAAVKMRFSDYLGSLMGDSDEAAVLKALAIGDRSSVSRELKETYRSAGAMHLLALSGLHVGIIYATVSLMLSFLGNSILSRLSKSVAILAFLWFYAIVSGLNSSILRAVIMISIYEISDLVGATRDAPVCVASSALLITLFAPESPRDIGFQLSYSAVIAIVAICPYLKSLLDTKSRILNFIWDSVCIAISCQCTCGFLAWLYFGNFPKYFLVTNLIAVPLATVIMYLIAITMLTIPFPMLNSLSVFVLHRAIHLLNEILKMIAL